MKAGHRALGEDERVTAPGWSLSRRGAVRLWCAAAALLVAWIATPGAVPLYDGIGIPDEPYRYVNPPAGSAKTPPPSSMSFSTPAENGTNPKAFYASTKEVSAQFGVFVTKQTLQGPTTTKVLRITGTPEAAPTAKTPYGVIDGNIFKVTLWADTSPTATLSAQGKDSLVYAMRATSAKIPAVTFLFRPTPSAAWVTVPNERLGTDSFQAYLQGSGEYALTPATAKSSSSGPRTIIIVLIVVVVALAGTVVLIRLSRRKSAQT